MPNLNIITSNRLEVLSKALADLVKEPLASPLDPEIIVVQSRGMERWVSLELARHNGICANVSFPFPNAFLNHIFRKFVPDYPEISPFEKGVMTFRIMERLPSYLNTSGFESLKAYLKDDVEGRKLFQLSERIADVYDQYLVFRPEMIFQWEKGKADHWQARLWRALTEGNGKYHRGWLHRKAIEKMHESSVNTDHLPRRVSVFGVSYLPPQYIYSFAEMSRHMEMRFFFLNPCKEFWMDIVTSREMKSIRDHYGSSDDTDLHASLHLDQGNRLIASMGMMGRDFFYRVYGFDVDIEERFEEGEPDSLLSCIQSDILNLKDRQFALDPYALKDDDISIQIHSCHGPMREIEILYDQLLSLFEQNPDLLPKDILVMTPDIEIYAPYIHAVFGAQTDDDIRIPFTVTDRSLESESPIISGFMSLIDLKDSRLTAAQIMGLLEIPGIREKFDLGESDLELLRHWIRDTRIRWGIDAAHRREMGLPDFPDNTWRSGIQRLLLGYAMPGRNRNLFKGILPYDYIEGNDGIILGKFLDFLERLFLNIDALYYARNTDEWVLFLNKILEEFFLTDEAMDRDIQLIRQVLGTLSQHSEIAGFSEPVEFEVIRSYLEGQFKTHSVDYGFLSGGVTFCAMLPMRSIPVGVICLIGMNSDTFPRKSTSLGFNYISRYPRKGDRSRRNDDKYLFLEALISARQILYISYVGQSIQDNSPVPPSPLVNELLDYISDGYGVPESRMMTCHRLQAFSHRYFNADNGKLFSYSKENLLAANSFLNSDTPPSFVSDKLPEPPDTWRHLTLNDLIAFLCHPARYFLEKRLEIVLSEKDTTLDETEPFILNGLEKYSIGQELLEVIQSGGDLREHMIVQKAGGGLPHGKVGDVFYREMGVDASQFSQRIRSSIAGNRLESLDFHFQIAGFHLAGCLQDLYETGQVRIRYGNKTSKDLLAAWVHHLALNMLEDDDLPKKTLLICKDTAWEFSPVNTCEDILEKLLKWYWVGLTLPIHFFPESSYAYASRFIEKKQKVDVCLNVANQKWVGSDFGRGESDDPSYQLCFRDISPIDNDFRQIALDVFSPLFQHCIESYIQDA